MMTKRGLSWDWTIVRLIRFARWKRALPVLALFVAPLLVACSQNSSPTPAPIAAPIAQIDTPIHEIVLPHDEPDFPAGRGKELFVTRCTVCHSLRYVTMQPDFSKKTWSKEVAKMINTYGAHVTGEEARQIIEYLATIKGSEGHTDSPAKK